jgi:glycosyltransferase involved in cell wall biosynthesis
VLCFDAPPSEPVRKYLELQNVTLEETPDLWRLAWRPARAVDRLLRRYRPSILHMHFTGFLSVHPWLARVHGVEKVFFTDHSSRPEGHVIRRAPPWKRAVARTINHPLTRLISISEFNRRCLVHAGLLPENRVVRIYNAVDLGRLVESKERGAEFRHQYGIPDGRAVILQVSWMIPEKGVGDLLDAARTVLERKTNVHFVLAGEGRCRQEYMRRADTMGIGGHVSWTGLVTDPFAEGLYAAADVVCQMSRWEEGFGWVIAEAMAHGRPIVATRVGGIPEIVRDGVTGLLVNRGDSAAMAEALIRLISDPELRARLGAAGRSHAEANFDLRSYTAQVLQLYGINGDR